MDHRRSRSAQASDRGQAAVLVVLVATAVTAVVISALATFGATVGDRVRAQSVADAVALASLEAGRPAADTVAARNGGVVVSWVRGPQPGEVTVTVRVGDQAATARASDAPPDD